MIHIVEVVLQEHGLASGGLLAQTGGQSLNLTTFPSKDEECAKHLLAELMHSPAVIAYDNLTGDLVAHKSLCTVLTAERFSQRVLGVSKNATVGTRTLFLSNGNNVVPVADMTRRVVTINLAPAEEIPAMRTFQRPGLLDDIRRERARYIAAALTIVRAWLAAGSPQGGGLALAGFGRWTELCREPLLWLGLPDPVASIREAITEDPDREMLGRLLTAWHATFDRRPTRVRDAMRERFENPMRQGLMRSSPRGKVQSATWEVSRSRKRSPPVRKQASLRAYLWFGFSGDVSPNEASAARQARRARPRGFPVVG